MLVRMLVSNKRRSTNLKTTPKPKKINSNFFWQNKGTLYWCHKLVLGLQEGHRSLDNTRNLQKLAQHNLCKGASDDDNECANHGMNEYRIYLVSYVASHKWG
jgi:hypothetical protein